MEGLVFYLHISSMLNRTRFEVLDAHKTYCPTDWQWDNHGRNDGTCNLWLVTDGRGTMRVGGKTYDLEAGDCFILRMDEPCSGRHDPRHPLTVPWIIFRAGNDSSVQWRIPAIYRRVVKLSFFAELVEHAILEHLHGDKKNGAAEDSLRVALHLLADQDGSVHEAGMSRERAEAIHQACERIRCEPGHAWTVAELADSCHVSPGHFTRQFKAYAKIGPREFITRTRIEAAKGLLRMSGHTIGEIAEILGYGDIFHFSRQFREQTGISPSLYRNGSSRNST